MPVDGSGILTREPETPEAAALRDERRRTAAAELAATVEHAAEVERLTRPLAQAQSAAACRSLYFLYN